MAMPKEKTKKEQNYLKKTIFIYGDPKIGKTTVASQLGDEKHKNIFFPTEAGHKEVEIYKWQKEVKDAEGNITLEDPTSWDDFRMCVAELTKQTEYTCLTIDTADNLFQWCSKYVNKKSGIQHESDAGFGKGYSLIKDEFLTVINYLTQKGFGVIFLSHAATSDKELANKKITYTDSTLPNTAKKVIHGLSDYILYFYSDIEGKRYIRTKGTQHINAGDRSGRLPEIMPLDAELLKVELMK